MGLCSQFMRMRWTTTLLWQVRIAKRAKVISQNQAGDSARLARAASLAGGLEAPLRMPFGGDTVAAAEAKYSFAAGERISRASGVETGLTNTRRSGVCRM